MSSHPQRIHKTNQNPRRSSAQQERSGTIPTTVVKARETGPCCDRSELRHERSVALRRGGGMLTSYSPVSSAEEPRSRPISRIVNGLRAKHMLAKRFALASYGCALKDCKREISNVYYRTRLTVQRPDFRVRKETRTFLTPFVHGMRAHASVIDGSLFRRMCSATEYQGIAKGFNTPLRAASVRESFDWLHRNVHLEEQRR